MTEALTQRFAELAAGNGDEVQAALLVNQWLHPKLDLSDLRSALNQLTSDVAEASASWEILQKKGFQGVSPGPQSESASRMDWVLEHRRGLPITLAILIIHIARQQGQEAVGINFPGHFLVRVGTSLIDPVGMQVTEENVWRGRLGAASFPVDPFSTATPAAIAQRMLNNLKITALQKRQPDKILGLLELQLALMPADAGLWLEQADCWRSLGSDSSALKAYEKALPLIVDPELKRRIRALMVGLSQNPDTYH